ncbi:MAG: TetR/AcrR family transcriptional regulator [Clostridia bacterium]|nr:TetR/AcrR family transcriptional regulator [Clostridia bacterium]
MNTPNNKRKKESQEKIERTFLQLIQKKNVEEISVSTICEISGLNRSTFYANYLDIYDLVEKVKERMADEFAQIQISENSKQDRNGYLNLFKTIKENQIFFKTYFKLESISITPATGFPVDLAEKYYNNKYIDYHIEFFRAGLNAIIKKWLNGGCKESPEEMSEIIYTEYTKKDLS